MAFWQILKKKKKEKKDTKKVEKNKEMKKTEKKRAVSASSVVKTKEGKEKTTKDLKTEKDSELIKETKDKKEVKKTVISKGKKKIEKEIAFRVLKNPHITEKATDLGIKNQYVFKVYPNINKTEIKKAIEELYDVDVLSIKIIKIPAKKRIMKRISGWKRGYKKAVVEIKEGQKIEGLI